MKLTKEQQQIVDIACNGKFPSLLITGGPGVGKSTIIAQLNQRLSQLYQTMYKEKTIQVPYGVALCATTGIASLNIGGQTIHSFTGIGTDLTMSAKDLAKKIRANQTAFVRWLAVGTFIIDEVSMMSGLLFTQLEAVARILRKADLPFGGIQVIAVADFHQLPPVMVDKEGFFFESPSLEAVFEDRMYELTEVFRQKNDQTLANLIRSIRLGEISSGQIAMLKGLVQPDDSKVHADAVHLYSTNEMVAVMNNDRITKTCEGEFVVSVSRDYIRQEGSETGGVAYSQLEKLITPSGLVLRKGAKVMLTTNYMDHGLANGSLGQVLGFIPVSTSLWYEWRDNPYYANQPLTSRQALTDEMFSTHVHDLVNIQFDTDEYLCPHWYFHRLVQTSGMPEPDAVLMKSLPRSETGECYSFAVSQFPVEYQQRLSEHFASVRLIANSHKKPAQTASTPLEVWFSNSLPEDDDKKRRVGAPTRKPTSLFPVKQVPKCIMLPVVRFQVRAIAGSSNATATSKVCVVGPHTFEVCAYNTTKGGELQKIVIGSRTQLPLRLAWASTIHKVQGLEISRIHADLGRSVFASGMALVALSRCPTMNGLSLRDFQTRSITMLDSRVKEFVSKIRKMHERRERKRRAEILGEPEEGSDDERDSKRARDDDDEEEFNETLADFN